ncbi:hypothetical protein DUNSADRAFT_11021 [Dunaliella salina]|uniref:Encoded protein n=1 Tax=Dunaliella salina TaxID=3046 RepID=A0ABQ7GE83_DUNSA|nr:hypothetical protein DUNSADRAFT_11021 [Dunaliella salina]|eukprot:KAF5832909.1 hypothetical protein DUNSADRAFT_11021 [Dunaliella salina]
MLLCKPVTPSFPSLQVVCKQCLILCKPLVFSELSAGSIGAHVLAAFACLVVGAPLPACCACALCAAVTAAVCAVGAAGCAGCKVALQSSQHAWMHASMEGGGGSTGGPAPGGPAAS